MLRRRSVSFEFDHLKKEVGRIKL